jgi:hypothetical protein
MVTNSRFVVDSGQSSQIDLRFTVSFVFSQTTVIKQKQARETRRIARVGRFAPSTLAFCGGKLNYVAGGFTWIDRKPFFRFRFGRQSLVIVTLPRKTGARERTRTSTPCGTRS